GVGWDREGVGVGAGDADGACAERKRLEGVRAPADAAVEKDGDGRPDRFENGRQRVERRDLTVDLAAAVVRDDDPVDAELDGAAGVGRVEHALEQGRQRREGAQRLDLFPAERGPSEEVEEEANGRAGPARAEVRERVPRVAAGEPDERPRGLPGDGTARPRV